MSSHKSILIGIDTGGTYTDAVGLDRKGHKVVATAKSLTTKGDLSIGVLDALASVVKNLAPDFNAANVAMVSISTTLATNAVVEGHGSAIALVLIGFDDAMVERTGLSKSFPEMPVIRIAGGHDHNGMEAKPLDLMRLETEVVRLAPQASAFAIASAFAVRNPRHEVLARDVIVRICGKPVTISRELTSSLDAPRRALTAVLNARLISRISTLVEAVSRAMLQLGINAPLMVVRGDGSLAAASEIALKPIETVLSGPAASMIGAKWLSGREDFIMSDIGGTTTDVGLLVQGKPVVAEQGADVGGWRTMVQAIDVRTIGLGGDSQVVLQLDGGIAVGPRRVVPQSLLGHHFSEVVDMLEADLSDSDFSSLHGRFVLLPFGSAGKADTAGLSLRESELLAKITSRPKPLRRAATSSGALRTIESLSRRGLVQLSGFTPSDAAHVLGLQENWSRPAARLAAAAVVRLRDMKVPADADIHNFCQSVWSRTVTLSAAIILDTATGRTLGANPVSQAVCDGSARLGQAHIAISPVVPIVAVGGPARVYYGEVAARLRCEVVFVDHFEVANAIGAAAGLVGLKTIVTVEGDGSGLFRIFGAEGVMEATSGTKALALAEDQARRHALLDLKHRGGQNAEVRVHIRKSYLPDAVGEDGLLRAEVIAEAIGDAASERV